MSCSRRTPIPKDLPRRRKTLEPGEIYPVQLTVRKELNERDDEPPTVVDVAWLSSDDDPQKS